MAYKVHKIVPLLPGKYPKLFSSVTKHRDGTATARLVEPTDLALLMSINNYLEEEDIYIVYFQTTHTPRTVKYGRSYTILAENFHNILKEHQRFLPNNLPFDDPITTVEAAELINVHIQYARRLAKTSRFEATKSGGMWYVSESSVVEYRKRRIKQVLMYEFGLGNGEMINHYLKQPVLRLPIKENNPAPIIAAFNVWLETNERAHVKQRMGKL